MHRAVKKMLLLSSKVGPNWGLKALSRVLQAIHASSQCQMISNEILQSKEISDHPQPPKKTTSFDDFDGHSLGQVLLRRRGVSVVFHHGSAPRARAALALSR